MRLVAPLMTFSNHPQFFDVFVEYVFRIHCAIRASVPLLEAALSRSRVLSADCQVAAKLVMYFAKHVEAERHHDEWLLEDAAHLGIEPEQFSERVPPSDVASMVGAQYYWIYHAHPIALLGYLAVVEGNPITIEALDKIVETKGIPRAALRTFYLHAREDKEHSAEIWRCIDSLPLRSFHSALLGLSSMLVTEQLAETVERVIDSVTRKGL